MDMFADGLMFPEGPVAMADGSLLVVEIAGEALTRLWPDGGKERVATIEGGPNGAALGPDGRIYVCNNGGFEWIRRAGGLIPIGIPATYSGGAIEAVDPRTGTVERLYASCDGHRLCAPNDLVFDDSGGFWFTDSGKRRARDGDRGFIYWARADGSEIREVIRGIAAPNGIGLSPDGRTLYAADTETGRIWSWEVVGPGEIAAAPWPSPNGGRLVIGMGGYRRLDSLAVTASGRICVAVLDHCHVAEISASGDRIAEHPFPDLMVSNICFGGADLRSAWITLSHSGRVFSTRWHEPGLRLHFQDLPT